MLNQNDIVLYRNSEDAVAIGIVRGNPGHNPAPDEYEIFKLEKNGKSHKIVGDSEKIGRANLFIKFAKIRKSKVTAKNWRTHASVNLNQLTDANIEEILTWPDLSDEQQVALLEKELDPIDETANDAEEEEAEAEAEAEEEPEPEAEVEEDTKQLTKRPITRRSTRASRAATRRTTRAAPKKKTSKKAKKPKVVLFSAYCNVLDFTGIESHSEWWQKKIDAERDRQKEQLPTFIRTATTNLRFDLPEKASVINRTPSQINFMDPRLKSDKKTILKSLSQDLSLIFNPDAVEESGPTLLKFTEVVQKIIADLDSSYGSKLNSKLDKTIVVKQYVNVPSL
jgi:hypothetical protein